jgi:hypothetical protein
MHAFTLFSRSRMFHAACMKVLGMIDDGISAQRAFEMLCDSPETVVPWTPTTPDEISICKAVDSLSPLHCTPAAVISILVYRVPGKLLFSRMHGGLRVQCPGLSAIAQWHIQYRIQKHSHSKILDDINTGFGEGTSKDKGWIFDLTQVYCIWARTLAPPSRTEHAHLYQWLHVQMRCGDDNHRMRVLHTLDLQGRMFLIPVRLLARRRKEVEPGLQGKLGGLLAEE